MNLSDLIPVEYNDVRTIEEREAAEIGNSINDFGFLSPLIVNRHPGRENRIVSGEQRWRQLLRAGHTVVPDMPNGSPGYIFVDLSPEREKELALRLNRNQGKWNYENLVKQFDPTELLGLGFERYEFVGVELPPPVDALSLEAPPSYNPPAAPASPSAPPASSSAPTSAPAPSTSAPAETAPPRPAGPPPEASVRIVQLFYDGNQAARYREAIDRVMALWPDTSTPSLVVLRALETIAASSETAQG